MQGMRKSVQDEFQGSGFNNWVSDGSKGNARRQSFDPITKHFLMTFTLIRSLLMSLFQVANATLVGTFNFPLTYLFMQFNLSCQLKYFINSYPLENLVFCLLFKCIRQFLKSTNYAVFPLPISALFRGPFVEIICFHSFQHIVISNGFD